MNTVLLNTFSLDGETVIKKCSGGGGGGIPINNQSKSVEFTENGTSEVRYDAGYTGLEKVSVKVAIPTEEKTVDITENGTTEVVAANGFLSKVVVNTNVASSGGGDTPSRPKWTGHADVDGLKAIGWTDEDIAYYQENGVNWNEEEDEYHKVTDDNKALYGVLTADNISTYKERIVYLPKIDTSAKTSMYQMFASCSSLVAIPQLDTANVTNMRSMFSTCYSLVSIPQLNTANVTEMNYMFYGCRSLVSIPQLDTANVTNMNNMFYNCYSLVAIPQLDTAKVSDMSNMFTYCYSLVAIPQLDTANVTNMRSMFNYCNALVSIPQLDTAKVTNIYQMLDYCLSLTHINLRNAKHAYQLNKSALLSKESLLYIINNEAATSAITITLASYAYTRLAEDADVVAALANHPNISLASA